MEYFLENRTPRCWVLDRQSNRKVVSIAASGMGADAWAIAAQEGKLKREEALSWINTSIDNTLMVNEGNHGWLFHFTDLDGNPVYYKGVSSIDTVLYWLGTRQAAYRLGDQDLIERVETNIQQIDQNWMLTNAGAKPHKKFFSHGFVWKDEQPEFFPYDWEEYSEGVLIYKLFGKSYTPTRVVHNLPLFVYYYPLCFFRDETMIKHLEKAIDYQIKYHDTIGYTACDGPDGYRIMEPNVVSPLAAWACEPFFPEKVKPVLEKLPVSPLTPAYHLKTGWVSEDPIGIDEGAALLTHYPVLP